jgi:L-aminopeptidase/D-esterase-like protein
MALQGAVGAGTGAHWGAISGTPRQGGIGLAQRSVKGGIVTAIVVLNAFGSVDGDHRAAFVDADLSTMSTGQATSLMCVITDVPCDHGTLMRMCVSAHGALARRVIPAHTLLDGDLAFASALQRGQVDLETSLRLGLATELAMEAAIVLAAGV